MFPALTFRTHFVVYAALKSDLVLKVELGSSRAKTEEIRPGSGAVNQFLLLCVLPLSSIFCLFLLFVKPSFLPLFLTKFVLVTCRDATESIVDLGAEIELTVKSGKHEVCEASLGRWAKLPLDTVSEFEVDLKFPAKERTKNSPADISSRVLGKAVLRVVLTKGNGVFEPGSVWNVQPTVPPSSGFSECVFFDNDKMLRKRVKTGDLVVFQESGFPGLAMSLASNSAYSRVAMILRLPDKYTGRERPYLIEVTSNPQKFIDSITEEPSSGIVLFKLWERVRSVQGGSVWLLPLLESLATDPLANLIDFAQRALATPGSPPEHLFIGPSADFLALLQEIGIKDSAAYCELMSASMCAGLLKMGGKRVPEPPILQTCASPKDPSGQATYTPSPFITPAHLVAQKDIFGPLVPIRAMEGKDAPPKQ